MDGLCNVLRSLPLRILLVERNTGDSWDGMDWIHQLNTRNLKGTCYSQKFLQLQLLSDQDLLEIMGKYAQSQQQEKQSKVYVKDKTRQVLLEKLKSIDPDLCRPLYAMFLTDAYIYGKDATKWNRNDILDYVIDREKERLSRSLQDTVQSTYPDKKLSTACLYLQCVATVLQDVPLEVLEKICPEKWQVIEKSRIVLRYP